jgi:hypothetical protein
VGAACEEEGNQAAEKNAFIMVFSFRQQMKQQFKVISSAAGLGDKNIKDFEKANNFCLNPDSPEPIFSDALRSKLRIMNGSSS